MLLESSSNADDREAHDFLSFLVIPCYYPFSDVHSDRCSRLSKANVESVRLAVVLPIQPSLFLVE